MHAQSTGRAAASTHVHRGIQPGGARPMVPLHRAKSASTGLLRMPDNSNSRVCTGDRLVLAASADPQTSTNTSDTVTSDGDAGIISKGNDVQAVLFMEGVMVQSEKLSRQVAAEALSELVASCRSAGLVTALVSTSARVDVDASLAAAAIDPSIFEGVVAADESDHQADGAHDGRRPSLDALLLEAASRVGVQPRACVVVWGAAACGQAARSAGMRCCAVTTMRTEQQMADESPDLIRPDIASITLEDLLSIPAPGTTAQQQQQQQQQPDTSAAASSSSTASSSASDASGSGSGNGLQASLNEWVPLPGGYRTTRRDLLKFGAMGGMLGSVYVLLSRAKAVSFVSFRGLLNQLLPGDTPPSMGGGSSTEERVAAFRRFIADLESRGGGRNVPAFPQGLTWLNAPPLALDRELRGKVVILDFWTYCCINCMHVLPDLTYLEAKYEGMPAVVVGVHSAKFDQEKDGEAIRNAVLRYDIRHPVVNDADMAMWRELGVTSWPTFAVVSPQGRLIAMLAGEGHRQDLDDLMAAALQYYGERGELDDTPVPMTLEKDRDPRLGTSPLRYPGKIAVDGAGGRLFISDSNNNRIVITDLGGKFIDQVGGNGEALLDGSFEAAAFNRPQGVAYDHSSDTLYVADTENHAVRAVALSPRTVRTLAGNGSQGQDYSGGRSGAAQSLSSPWDVALGPAPGSTSSSSTVPGNNPGASTTVVYVAMAGQHQIWAVDPSNGQAAAVSGNGAERNQNGADGLSTSWAQPSGLALQPGTNRLFVADSESSAVRSIDLSTMRSSPHVGGDPLFAENLFRFGDVDGAGGAALLQHPLAVAALPDGRVAVADSYNSKVKVLDPRDNRIVTLAGSGRAGFADGPGLSAQLSEPAGLALGPDGSTLFIADTNNSLIRTLDLGTGRVATLQLLGVPPPRVAPGSRPAAAAAAGGAVPPPPQGAAVVRTELWTSGSAEVAVEVVLPQGYHYTKGAGSAIEASVLGPAAGTVDVRPPPGSRVALREGEPARFTLTRPATTTTTTSSSSSTAAASEGAGAHGGGVVRLSARIYFCQDEDVCLFEEVVFDVPFGGEVGGSPSSPSSPARAEAADGSGGSTGGSIGGSTGSTTGDLQRLVLPYRVSAKAPVVALPKLS